MEEFWIPLLIRAAVTAAVVVAATAAAERVGPFWAALIGAFPTSAGPAYAMLAMKTDAAFVAASAVTSLATMIAIAPFVVSLIYLAPRTNVFITVGSGAAVWAIFAIPLTQVSWTPMSALAVNIVMYGFCIWLTRDIKSKLENFSPKVPRWFELPLRALVVGLFVAVVVTLSDTLGTIGTGLGAVFPIVFLSLSAILHIRLGGVALAMTMRGALRVVSVMILALLTVHYGVLEWGKAIGLSAALLVSIVWAMMFVLLNRRKAIAA